MRDFTKVDAAKFLYKLICEGTEKARAAAIAAQSSITAACQSNSQFRDEQEKQDWGGGWGLPASPYSEAQIKHLQTLATRESEAFALWKKTRDWYFEDIATKYINDK